MFEVLKMVLVGILVISITLLICAVALLTLALTNAVKPPTPQPPKLRIGQCRPDGSFVTRDDL